MKKLVKRGQIIDQKKLKKICPLSTLGLPVQQDILALRKTRPLVSHQVMSSYTNATTDPLAQGLAYCDLIWYNRQSCVIQLVLTSSHKRRVWGLRESDTRVLTWESLQAVINFYHALLYYNDDNTNKIIKPTTLRSLWCVLHQRYPGPWRITMFVNNLIPKSKCD